MTAVHIEWAKALARCECWHEEVKFLREEMRCILHSLMWESDEWHRHAKQDDADVGEAI